ncbi:MAG TPA: TMEM175 family protein [Casimicrobiaceae bacterium]
MKSKHSSSSAESPTGHRLAAYSDAVFAVIVTIMVLELKAPEEASFSALLPLWPIALSYAVSYGFIAIIWINHHYLMRLVGAPSLRLMWVNFAHLFLVSLVPFATAWVARTHLASAPVVSYAALFVGIDLVYNVFERDVLARALPEHVSPQRRRAARRRSLIVLSLFVGAIAVAFVAPRVGFGLVCTALLMHVRPDPR